MTAAASNSDALKSMDEFKKGLQQRLQDHEQELKAEKSKRAGASSEHLHIAPLSAGVHNDASSCT